MKTAIFLRGRPRTWNYIAQHVINTYDSIYDPDWFVVLPLDTNTVTVESLKKDFQNSRLKSIQVLDPKDYPFGGERIDTPQQQIQWQHRPSSYWRLAWYDYHAGLAKRTVESEEKQRYDCVLAIRFDCWPCIDLEDSVQVTEAKTLLDSLQISDISLQGSIKDSDWHTPDLSWRAGGWAADIYCLRYWDSQYTEGVNQATHFHEFSLPLYYCASNRLNNRSNVGTIANGIIRPSMVDRLPMNTQRLLIDQSWVKLSLNEKLLWCKQKKIDSRDYAELETVCSNSWLHWYGLRQAGSISGQ